MSDAEVEKKFRSTVEPKYGKDRASAILAKCWEFDKITKVTELLEMFT
jgi:2-methylcitrate dehydratase